MLRNILSEYSPAISYALYFFSLLKKDRFYQVLYWPANPFKDISVILVKFKLMNAFFFC